MCMHVPVSVSTILSLMPPANSLSKLRRDCTPVADLVVFVTPGAVKLHPWKEWEQISFSTSSHDQLIGTSMTFAVTFAVPSYIATA